ncbi:MAG: ATP-binding cassette domain-containing protein [Pirellulales bacterium]
MPADQPTPDAVTPRAVTPRVQLSSTPTAGAKLRVESLRVAYGAQGVLEDVTFTVSAGQTLVILGESGCGKTTLLKALAGLVSRESGQVLLDGSEVVSLPLPRRGVIYLDQEPLLFEHLSVADNLGFSMRMQGAKPEEIAREVERMLVALELANHGRKRDEQLSGGQRQRAAFGRALLARPRLLLLDEPFGSLDSRTRAQMQTLFASLSRQHHITSVFVTHDVKEALIVGDHIARMNEGRLIQYADRESFVRDDATGVRAEIDFWRSLPTNER